MIKKIKHNIVPWLQNNFELNRTDFEGNNRPMEGLRGIAVFLVFLVHYVSLILPFIQTNTLLHPFALAVGNLGNIGVDLFFLLSGYLIYGSLMARDKPFLAYISRRIRRIYPTFTGVFILYIFLSVLFPQASKIPTDGGQIPYLLANFFLLPSLVSQKPMIVVAWSLSYEMFYYFTIPFIILLLDLRTRSTLWRLAALATLLFVSCALFAVFDGPLRMIMFIAGIFLYETFHARLHPAPSAWFSFLLITATIYLLLHPLSGAGWEIARVMSVFITFYILVFTSFSMPQGLWGRFFTWTPLRWLGNMSYSYYLLHGLILKGCALFLLLWIAPGQASPLFFWIALPFLFVLTVVGSSLLFLLIERPFSLRPSKRLRSMALPSLLLFFFIAALSFTPFQTHAQERAHLLDRKVLIKTFSDEFDGFSWYAEDRYKRAGGGTWQTNFGYSWAKPDEMKNRTLPSNKELQLYVDTRFRGSGYTMLDLNPFSVRNGILAIKATHTPKNAQPYTYDFPYVSGLITTRRTFSQRYGVFEIRAKMPKGKGLWPAFWLLPIDGSWPPEIDVLEILGHHPNILHTALHSGKISQKQSTRKENKIPDSSENFHTYSVDWGPEEIAFFFDDKEVARHPTPPDMHKPMFLLANLAVGGWAGVPDAATSFPATYEIDWVRVYQKKRTSE